MGANTVACALLARCLGSEPKHVYSRGEGSLEGRHAQVDSTRATNLHWRQAGRRPGSARDEQAGKRRG